MKRALSLLLVCLLAVFAAPAVSAPAPDETAPPAAGEYDGYLVAMAEPLSPGAAEAAGCEAVRDDLYYAETIWDAAALSALGDVDYCVTNDILTVLDAYDGYETNLWNLLSVGASAGWNHRDKAGRRDRLGDGVTVAVVDSGVMTDHPDLAGAKVTGYVILSSDEDGVDGWHGTFVAGLLAAGVNNGIGVDGMVPNVNLLPICITWGGGKTDVKTAVAGLSRAVELGADVITFSIGGTNDNEALRRACQDAADAGCILVTAAGNYTSGRTMSVNNYMYPAAYDCVVSVSACRQEGGDAVFDDSYSYFNNKVTVSAPGTGVKSLYPDGGTATKDGTSFAAPIVTAMAVMAKQADRRMDTGGFVNLLKASAADLGDPGYDPYYGYGYVNVPAFLKALDQTAKPPLYTDVPDDAWYYDSVLWAAANGVMNGTGNGVFSPDEATSRAMTVTILWRMAGEPAATGDLTFLDVPAGTWYTSAVRWAAANGIVDGYSKTAFGPSDPVTREQLAAILYRYARHAGADTEGTFPALDRFPDARAVSGWALSALRWAVGTKLIGGMGDGTLSPRAQASRAQVAAIVMRFTEHSK